MIPLCTADMPHPPDMRAGSRCGSWEWGGGGASLDGGATQSGPTTQFPSPASSRGGCLSSTTASPKQCHPTARRPVQPKSPSRLAINQFVLCESLSIYVAAKHDFPIFLQCVGSMLSATDWEAPPTDIYLKSCESPHGLNSLHRFLLILCHVDW
jgi:hypothetical protein